MAGEAEEVRGGYSEKAVKENEKRWNRFREDANFGEMQRQIKMVAELAGLKRDNLGITWGITVFVDGQTTLRINHADYALFDVRNPDKPFEQRNAFLAFVPGEGAVRESAAQKLKRKAFAAEYSVRAGFVRLVPESKTAVFKVSEFDFVTDIQEIRLGIRRHVDARQRRLFGPTRHNPLTAELFG
jgi:hypothetical protein